MSGKVSREKKAELIHPYNDFKIITGAATCALEIYEEINDVDYLLVPIGGGGLSSGSLLATKYFSPKTTVIGVQPYLARDAKDALEKGSVQPQYPPLSLAEGVRASLKDVTFSVLSTHMKDIILITE
jgi:threonine dehydratase